MSTAPVLIQTMWRTGGTYRAFRLRETNPASLFYEPLRKDFSRHPRRSRERWASNGMQRELGHAEAAFHHLTDFPADAEGMVPGHREAFAWQPFILDRDEPAPALAAYPTELVRTAPRRPLSKFCRARLVGGLLA